MLLLRKKKILAALSSAGVPYQPMIIDDGPILYWPLDDVSGTIARDLIGASNGTISGDVTLNSPGIGNSKSLKYNAGRNGLVVGTHPGPALSTAFTYELWVFPRTTGGLNNPFINLPGTTQWYWDTGANTIQFNYAPGAQSLNWSHVIPFETWHHIVLVGGSNQCDFYVDGVKVNPTKALTITTNSGIGTEAGSFSGGQGFVGSLQDIAVYRKALSGAEILEHYKARNP